MKLNWWILYKLNKNPISLENIKHVGFKSNNLSNYYSSSLRHLQHLDLTFFLVGKSGGADKEPHIIKVDEISSIFPKAILQQHSDSINLNNSLFTFELIQIILKLQRISMKRKPCQKDEQDNVHMTQSNLLICLKNQEGYENKELNDSLHLQYYGFCDIDNLVPFKNIHTLFLNNNTIEVIQNLQSLSSLCTLNLSYNRIRNFKGLAHLTNLHTLDLSHNFIERIEQEQIASLAKLSQLKLGSNKFSSYESMKSVITLSESLNCLDLNSNESFTFNELFYSELLRSMPLVSVLSLQNTAFSRSVPSYRKETINAGQSLLFLDDRPVTEEERMLARAWKEGGLVLEKEVRQKFREKLQQKHSKIYSQMEERTRIAEQKRKMAYDKLTCWQQSQLKELLNKIHHEDYEILSEDQKNLIKLKIEDYQKYLELMREQMSQVDLEKVLGDGKVEVPKMLIDKETPEVIFVYNVSQEQIPLIKEKYYPNDPRQIIAVNYEQKSEIRWIQQYDALLLDCYNQLKGNMDLLVATFNLSLYDFDESASRKFKRFELEELKTHLTRIMQEEEKRQRSLEVLYELD